MTLKQISVLAAITLALTIPASASAQATTATTTSSPTPPSFLSQTEISGFVDIYFSRNFNKPATGLAQLRNFDVQHDSFSLNLAELAFEKKPAATSRGGFRLDLDYGRQSQMVNTSDPGGATLQNVGQAYASYLTPNGVQLDFGKFYSPIGFEGIKTRDNWNYSRSLVYALAEPYYHAGLRANYTVNDRVAIAGFLVNGWNNVVDNNGGKTIGGQITLKLTSSVTLVETYLGGPEQAGNASDWRHISDTILTWSPKSAVTLAANYDYGRDTVDGASVTWQGIAGYVRYQPVSWFGLTPRAEYYNDSDAFSTGVSQKLTGLTVTSDFRQNNGISLRVEYRRDMSNRAFFQQKTSDLVKHQDTLTVGVIYAFSSK